MSRNLFASALAALVLLWNAGLANAQQSGTAAEARAMLDRAVAALKTEFKSTALSEFNDKNNKQYHDRDLYVFCNNMSDGKTTAHVNAALIGTDIRTIKVKDDPLGQRIYDAMKATPEGSVATVDYSFPKPGTTEPVPKESFVTRVGEPGLRRRLLQIAGPSREIERTQDRAINPKVVLGKPIIRSIHW
jgi:hypothetical protein